MKAGFKTTEFWLTLAYGLFAPILMRKAQDFGLDPNAIGMALGGMGLEIGLRRVRALRSAPAR